MSRTAGPSGPAEVADQLSGGLEPADVADRGQERRRADDVHTRHGQQVPGVGGEQRLPGDHTLDLGDLGVEELDVAHARLDRLALLDRQLQSPQPLAAGLAEQIGERTAAHQPAHQHRVHLVL
jgi:hypothetical protein